MWRGLTKDIGVHVQEGCTVTVSGPEDGGANVFVALGDPSDYCELVFLGDAFREFMEVANAALRRMDEDDAADTGVPAQS